MHCCSRPPGKILNWRLIPTQRHPAHYEPAHVPINDTRYAVVDAMEFWGICVAAEPFKQEPPSSGVPLLFSPLIGRREVEVFMQEVERSVTIYAMTALEKLNVDAVS